MMVTLNDKLYEAFALDLKRHGDFWRICRPTTFAEMLLTYRKKLDGYTDSDLISMVNWAVRYHLCKRLPIDVCNLSLNAVEAKLGAADAKIMRAYRPTLQEMTTAVENYKDNSVYDLSRDLDYLAVLGELDLDADLDMLMSRIANIGLALLTNTSINECSLV
ncbi:hypothetical protein [Pedobacter sp. V48]|uniref:hypothetical protein n=1 Tax=Pedobacter sp. V48 TaxID=509635 RepID=UPI0003E4D05B|nr:hypothetical protein [Pedobacter sp. V48]ETZ22822.1 hypothetical protein N824_21265 [Pedobacter sp. V48]